MPVNDDNLELMLKNAKTKLNDTNTKLSQLRKFIADCEEIVKTPTEANHNIMEIKKDRLLGIELSVSRRQAVYDKLLADETYLGL